MTQLSWTAESLRRGHPGAKVAGAGQLSESVKSAPVMRVLRGEGAFVHRNRAPSMARLPTATEADLNYYYEQVETLWLGGSRTTFAQILAQLPATERHIARLAEGLTTLVERNWLKLRDIPVSGSSDEGGEPCYVPIRRPAHSPAAFVSDSPSAASIVS